MTANLLRRLDLFLKRFVPTADLQVDNKIDLSDCKSLGVDMDKINNRVEAHAHNIGVLYKLARHCNIS